IRWQALSRVRRRCLLDQRRGQDLPQAHLGDRGAVRPQAAAAERAEVMALRLEGKVAMVTGAARGIGRAVARRFAEEGADIVLFDIARDLPGVPYPGATRQQLDDAVAEVKKLGRRASVHIADVTDSRALTDAVAQAKKELGHIDLLVTAAGIDSW